MKNSIFINSRYFYWLVAVYFTSLLITGLIAEHFFDIAPCSLCYYQRYVMVTILILSLGIVFSGYDKKFFTILVFLIAVSGIALSGFHVGVEQKWWSVPESCIGKVDLVSTDPAEMLKSLQNQMKHQKIARCDQINWRMFGLPASWYTCLAFIFAAMMILWRECTTPKK